MIVQWLDSAPSHWTTPDWPDTLIARRRLPRLRRTASHKSSCSSRSSSSCSSTTTWRSRRTLAVSFTASTTCSSQGESCRRVLWSQCMPRRGSHADASNAAPPSSRHGVLTCARLSLDRMPDVPESFEAVEEDRVFSRSSITAPIASNQAAMAKAAAGAAARIAARAARGGEVSSSDDDSDGEGSEGGKAAGK